MQPRDPDVRERGGVRRPLAEVDRPRVEALDGVQAFERGEQRDAPLRHVRDAEELWGAVDERELAEAREGAVQLGDVVPLPAHEGEALEGGREGLDERADGRAVFFAEGAEAVEVSVVFAQEEGWVEGWKAVDGFALDG